MKLIPRKEWGARPPRGTDGVPSTRGVKVHYTGSRVDPGLKDDHGKCRRMVQSIQRHHMDDNHWNDIGYTAVVCHHGYVFEGRGPGVLCAANGLGLNGDHYAVCGLVGNAGLTTPSDAMLNGILDAIRWLRNRGRAGSEIKLHMDGYSTDCPGPKLSAWVRDGAPRPGAPVPPAFPLPAGHWFGLESPNRRNHSGYWAPDREHIKRIQRWLRVPQTGRYDVATKRRVWSFQGSRRLVRDGRVGPMTWRELAAQEG